jgi:toxin-antitoxin system PIN domain toxin
MILADVNVYIYAHRQDLAEHADYANWLVELVESEEPFAASELALSGFLRIVTNPKIFHTPTPLDTALAFVSEILDRPNCVPLRPGPRHWALFTDLCRTARARGKLVADAYHAALAIEHGCEFVSADGDFARFKGLRWRHPLSPGG